ncbi:MAG: SDR family NAD(P)-dependent oxidoreductase [Solirubrobacterales bacterium]
MTEGQLLRDRVAVITGAASGMGKASAELFAAQGAAVLVADLNGEAAEGVAAAIREDGGKAIGLRTDVSSAVDVEAMIACAESELGGLDVLYNNAGLWLLGAEGYEEGRTDAPSPLLTEDVWDRTVGVSMKGTYLACRFGIPALRRRGGGSIINVSSIAAFRVGSGASDAYTAAKGGVAAMTRSLAVEHAPDRIRVNCIVPGPIETPMSDAIPAHHKKAFGDLVPLGRWGTPQEIAQMALFLASDTSSYCTGAHFVVDGGYLAK